LTSVESWHVFFIVLLAVEGCFELSIEGVSIFELSHPLDIGLARRLAAMVSGLPLQPLDATSVGLWTHVATRMLRRGDNFARFNHVPVVRFRWNTITSDGRRFPDRRIFPIVAKCVSSLVGSQRAYWIV